MSKADEEAQAEAEAEAQADLKQLNEDARQLLLRNARELMKLFSDDRAFLAAKKALESSTRQVEVLEQYIAERNAEGWNLAWAMVRLLQNMGLDQ